MEVRELTVDEFPLWDRLVAESPQGTIFNERWWMDIVTQGGVQLLGCFQGTALHAGVPIWPVRTLGVERLRQPPLTPYWGPILRPLTGKAETRLSHEFHLLHILSEALGAWPDITMQFHPSLRNWLPFYWRGFTQTTRYTHRIPDWSCLQPFEQHAAKSVRDKLRYAQQNGLRPEVSVDPALVTEMCRQSMERQGVRSSAEIQQFWPALARACRERERLFTLAVYDHARNPHYACAMIWDARCAYGILGGGNPLFRNSQAGTLAHWHELQYAATIAPTFDFEGSMLEPVEMFFRKFGGELTPYLHVSKMASPRLNLARACQRAFLGLQQTIRRRRHPFSRKSEVANEPSTPVETG